jgi:hypothetical protein
MENSSLVTGDDSDILGNLVGWLVGPQSLFTDISRRVYVLTPSTSQGADLSILYLDGFYFSIPPAHFFFSSNVFNGRLWLGLACFSWCVVFVCFVFKSSLSPLSD